MPVPNRPADYELIIPEGGALSQLEYLSRVGGEGPILPRQSGSSDAEAAFDGKRWFLHAAPGRYVGAAFNNSSDFFDPVINGQSGFKVGATTVEVEMYQPRASYMPLDSSLEEQNKHFSPLAYANYSMYAQYLSFDKPLTIYDSEVSMQPGQSGFPFRVGAGPGDGSQFSRSGAPARQSPRRVVAHLTSQVASKSFVEIDGIKVWETPASPWDVLAQDMWLGVYLYRNNSTNSLDCPRLYAHRIWIDPLDGGSFDPYLNNLQHKSTTKGAKFFD